MAKVEKIEKNKFRLLAGTHYENGNTYHRGDTVESDRDLTVVFKNKFHLLVKKLDDTMEAKPEFAFVMVSAGKGRFNVVNKTTGSPINDTLLTKDEAQTLMDTL